MLKKIRQFLTPGWVLTAIVAIAFSYVAFTVLAPWQLGKNTATQHRNEQLKHAFEVDPVDVGNLMAPGSSLHDGDEWRRVTAQGEFVPNSEVLLRNRPVDGAPAIQVLNVFRTDSGENYVVNRGYVRPSGTAIPAIEPAPTGHVTISAYTRHNELTPVTEPIIEDRLQVYGIETSQIEGLLQKRLRSADANASANATKDNPDAVRLHHDWLQLDENSPGVIAAIPLPQLESGPYLSYGIQWIFFGLMAPAAVVWFVIAEVRERRRDREEQEAHEAELAASRGSTSSSSSTGASSSSNSATKVSSSEEAARDTSASESSGQESSGRENASKASHKGGEPANNPAGKAREQGANEPAGRGAEDAEEIRAHRLAQRYGDSGHRFGGKRRDDRYDERF